MSLCYEWGACHCEYCQEQVNDVLGRPKCSLVVGEQYMMTVNGRDGFRVLLLSSDEVTPRNERRAHVLVLEDNSYVKAGAECRPLANTLGPLPR